jgi:tetratricopeptide (TPR) repeat protein
MHQVFADARLQRVFEAQRTALGASPGFGPVGGGPTPRVIGRGMQVVVQDLPPRASEARAAAERAFRRALSEDPSLDEARVRLAHVLLDRGRHDEAAREIERLVAAGAPQPFLAYYAAVVEGLVARARGRVDDAESAFTRALETVPDAQVPRLALSELAEARGDRVGAIAALAALEGALSRPVNDPWWIVGRTHGRTARETIDGMSWELR